MFPAGNKTRRLSSVNHTTKTINQRHKLFRQSRENFVIPKNILHSLDVLHDVWVKSQDSEKGLVFILFRSRFGVLFSRS